MSAIHIKESVLKALPNIFHPLTPPLFVEQGQMPCHDKNKSKTAIIYINLCGVYFIRPISFSKKYKLSQFISTYDISEIDYKDRLQCEIITKTKSLYIHCEHCEEAVSCILSARRLLFKDMKENYKIQVIGFPSPPVSPDLQLPHDVSIVSLRYIAMCSKRSFLPEGRILDAFNKFNPVTHVTLTLDEACIAPPNVKNLLYPIYTFRHIQILRFKNFSPYFVCRFIHHLIKRAFKVDSIIIEGYSFIVPEQLRMENTRGLRPLCLVFKNCNFSDEINDRLFEQLGKYPGEISRISFINCSISPKGWKSLFDTITQSRSFKELEEFEINNIDSNAFYDEPVTEGVKALLKHCRYILRLSVANWTQPIHFGINNIQNYLLLSEINLSGQDMTQPLPDDFKMLRMVHSLNLSRCNFTFNSLQSLFKVLSTTRAPLAIRLADLKLPDAHWKNFYTNLNTFPRLNSLCELDWSGNALYSQDIGNFASYFFSGNKLRYLQIDRIFGSQQAEDLYNLLRCLSEKTIVGISIGGSPELNFGGNLKSLLKSVELLMNLHILRLDGQKITDFDTASLLDYLKVQRTLNDVSFDDTCINDQQRFFDFYKDVCSLNIDAVGRPFKDMNRLFGPDLSNVINPSHYDEFQSQIRLKLDMVCDSCRQFYFCKFMSPEFDPKIYLWFGECYPNSFFDESRYDTFGLKKENMRHQMPTLCAISHKQLLRNLAAYHSRYLVTPERLPRYRIKLDTFEPKFLADSTTNEQSFAFLNKENNYDDDMFATTQFGFGFGTILPNQNFDDFYNTQNLYDTQQYDQTTFDQQPVYDQAEQFDQMYDQQQFDQQQFDIQQNEQPQFENTGYDQQFVPQPQFDQQQFDTNQYDQQQQFVPPPFEQPQYDQQSFDQQQFNPQYQQDYSYDQNQQFDQQNQFQQQQYGQESFDANNFQDPNQFQQQQYTQEQYNPINLNPVPPAEIQQQQQQQQTHHDDFSKTLNRFMSHNVIDYEDQAPELPSLRSDLHEQSMVAKQPSEVTEVKPLLQCTIKPRDKNAETPSNVPPPMFPLGTETTENSSGLFIPPPSGVTIPPPSNLAFPAPLTNNQPFVPAPVPLTPAQQEPPKISEPAQQQQQQQNQEEPPAPPQQTPIMQNITVIPPPNQPVLQQQQPQKVQEQVQPSEPKVTIEKTVTVTETTTNNQQQQKPQEQVHVPDLTASSLSSKPPVLNPHIPPPTGFTPSNQQQPTPFPAIPQNKSPALPAAPAKKKKTAQFQSAAGPLRLQSTIGLASSKNLPPAQRTVKVDGGKVVEIPNETTLKAPEQIHQWKPFDDIDIPDLAVTSNAASRQDLPKLIVIDTPVSVENFYQNDSLPFNLPQPTLSLPIGTMSHPLQARVFLKPPNIRILGVPDEW